MLRNCLQFPVVLNYLGHDELDVLEDSEALTALLCNCSHLLPDEDSFIDSQGQIYALDEQGQLQQKEGSVSLSEFNGLLQRHFAATVNSCAAKSSVDSIAAGMLAIIDATKR